jgi:hypothetical protein
MIVFFERVAAVRTIPRPGRPPLTPPAPFFLARREAGWPAPDSPGAPAFGLPRAPQLEENFALDSLEATGDGLAQA